MKNYPKALSYSTKGFGQRADLSPEGTEKSMPTPAALCQCLAISMLNCMILNLRVAFIAPVSLALEGFSFIMFQIRELILWKHHVLQVVSFIHVSA
jgi:hypothetical protein